MTVVAVTSETTTVTIGADVTTVTATGSIGPTGATGPAGADGADGVGVPVGGTTGQVLAKASAANYDTAWSAPSGGVTDHGALTGLADDDHTQYLTKGLAALDPLTAVEPTDLLYVVDDPAGTPLSKKATVGDVVEASGRIGRTWASEYGASQKAWVLPFCDSLRAEAGNQRALTADTMFYWPFRWARTALIDAVRFEVTVAGTGLVLGVYRLGSNGQPTGTPVIDTGAIPVTSGGGKAAVVNTTLPAGAYLLAALSDNSALNVRANASSVFWPEIFIWGGANVWVAMRTVAYAYATSMPASPPAWTTPSSASPVPLFAFEVGSWA